MKKTLFAALALAFVASCSNEEVVEMAQKEAIAFDNAFVDNSTRSVYDPSYSNTKLFANFAVYGFVDQATLFDGTTVTGSALNGDWTYQGKQYWIAGAKYNFSAVAPATGWTKTSASKDGVTLEFTNTDGKQDVLFAKSSEITGLATGNSKVAFTFKHILSKVKFTFKNEYDAAGATIRVKDIKIVNPYKKAIVVLGTTTGIENGQQSSNIITANWDGHTTESNFNLEFGNAATAGVNADEDFGFETKDNANIKESYNELLLIPVKDAQIKKEYDVRFIVDLLINGTEVASYSHKATVSFAPQAGLTYNITAIINANNIDPENKNQEPIEFTVTNIKDWDNGVNPDNITTTTPNEEEGA